MMFPWLELLLHLTWVWLNFVQAHINIWSCFQGLDFTDCLWALLLHPSQVLLKYHFCFIFDIDCALMGFNGLQGRLESYLLTVLCVTVLMTYLVGVREASHGGGVFGRSFKQVFSPNHLIHFCHFFGIFTWCPILRVVRGVREDISKTIVWVLTFGDFCDDKFVDSSLALSKLLEPIYNVDLSLQFLNTLTEHFFISIRLTLSTLAATATTKL